VEGEANFGKGEHFAMIAKQTRLSLELSAADADRPLRFIRNDSLHQQHRAIDGLLPAPFLRSAQQCFAGQT
jgi:hypothetical protein